MQVPKHSHALRVLLFCVTLSLAMVRPALPQQVKDAVHADNSDLTKLYEVDQSERTGPNIDWTALYYHDIERRAKVQQMLNEGAVQTAADYYHAAMVFQHGQTPDDYLLAHLLAVTAISKGSKEARWLSAATMDRYLRSIWQPQVYGTQYSRSSNKEAWSHQAINEHLVSDSMRAGLCVVPLGKQRDAQTSKDKDAMPASTGLQPGE
jgi:hypothetical protein